MRQPKEQNSIRRRGVTTIECTVVLGVLLTMLIVCLDLALAVVRYNSLCEGARRGARSVIVRGKSATSLGPLGPNDWEFTADTSNAVANSFRFILTAMDPKDVTAKFEWLDGNNEPDSRIRVTLQYEHKPLLPFYGNLALKTTSTMGIAH